MDEQFESRWLAGGWAWAQATLLALVGLCLGWFAMLLVTEPGLTPYVLLMAPMAGGVIALGALAGGLAGALVGALLSVLRVNRLAPLIGASVGALGSVPVFGLFDGEGVSSAAWVASAWFVACGLFAGFRFLRLSGQLEVPATS